MDNQEITRNFFKNDKFVELAGIVIEEITEEQVTVSAKISAHHLNANGAVQGGMLYTLADFAFAVLGNHVHPMTVTQGGHIQYIRPAITTYIKATAKETIRAGHNTISEVVITNDKDEIVCICNFNGFVKDVDRNTMMK